MQRSAYPRMDTGLTLCLTQHVVRSFERIEHYLHVVVLQGTQAGLV